MMDTFEHTCIPNDGLARYPTNSTAECCDHCLATLGCFSCECDGGHCRRNLTVCLRGFCATNAEHVHAELCWSDSIWCCLFTRWSGVVRHDEGVCFLNTDDVQQGQAIPPYWPSTPGNFNRFI
jgi:hypothetical protein